MQNLEVFELGAKGRCSLLTGASTGELRVPGYRGLVLRVDDLWAEQGRLAR